MASPEIEALTQALSRLPGLGPRSARRAVLHLIKKRETALRNLEKAREALAARTDERNLPRQAEKGVTGESETESEGEDAR